MSTRYLTGLILSALLANPKAFAQATRTEVLEQEKTAKVANFKAQEREEGDRIITRLQDLLTPEAPGSRLTFGDFRPGAGFAAGVDYSAPIGRALWTTGGAWSVKNFKQAHSVLDLPSTFGDRVQVSVAARWDDLLDLRFFGLGNSSVHENQVSYGLRSVDAGVRAELRAGRRFRYGGAIGGFAAHSSNGSGSEPPVSDVFVPSTAPGLGSAPAWLHTTVFAAYDTRESEGYTHSGALYSVTLNRYMDPDGRFTFNRAQIDARQFIPIVHENWVFALRGRMEMTGADSGQTIPYFMLPTVGGRDSLPGFNEYRFTDRNSLLLRSELRWATSPVVDMALTFDQGKVGPRVSDLDLSGLKRSVGIGIRFHGPKVTALRFDVAHSTEGWRFALGPGVSF